MNVLFTESFLNDFPELVPGAYVVAFGSTSAIIIGSVNVYDTSTQSLILWGDDNFTSILDGAYENEFFWMQLVNGTDVYNIVDLVYGSGSNVYQTNSFSTILSGTFQLQCSIEDDSNLDYDNLIVTEINDPCMSLNEYNSILLELNPIQSRSFNEGWNMFGYPCQNQKSVAEIFSDVESDLYIIKNNEGSFYWPEFDFDGLGDLIPLEGYQTKFYNSISEFSFCDFSIDFPTINISGCTDCEACNYNPLSSHDDNSCTYKTLGYDCLGNQEEISIGQYVREYDGFVFYYDSIDDRGLIASNNILFEGSSDPYGWGSPGYEWGCFDHSVLNENEQGTKEGKLVMAHKTLKIY